MRNLLKTFFETEPYVELAYLYGSTAAKREGALSDIDIGVYLTEKIERKEYFDLHLKLVGKISSLLRTKRIDLTLMNETPIPLNFEIIKANCPVFIRSRDKKVEVEHKIMSRYLDRRYYDLRSTEIFLSKVRENGLSF